MAVRVEHQAEPIPGYRLIERLGGGGFGEVWKAEAPGGLFKAIKFVYGDLESLGEDGARADQELKALKRVKSVHHPYILSLERYDIIDGQLLIVMELADRTLWDRFRECRAQGLPGIPREELLNYLRETAEALDLMNIQYQLQHLDIKPQNLFLIHNHVKVADFGLVKDLEGMMASVTGGVTPGYAAPETFDGWVSRFCDQYSLAIVYQELLTGQRPFVGTTVRQLVLQHLQGKPDLSPLPAHDKAIIARALSKNPDQRFPTCQELARELREAASGGRPTAPPPSLPLLPLESGTGAVPTREIDNAPPAAETPGAALGQTPASPEDEKTQGAPLRRPPPIPSLPTPGVMPSHSDLHPPLEVAPSAPTVGGVTPRPEPSETPGTSKPPVTPSFSSRKDAARHQAEGVLLPALVIGLGHLGLRTLKELRREIHERFGQRRRPAQRPPATPGHRRRDDAGGAARQGARGAAAQRVAAGPTVSAQPLPQGRQRRPGGDRLAQSEDALSYPPAADLRWPAGAGPIGLRGQLPQHCPPPGSRVE